MSGLENFPIALANKIKKWDYDKSIEKMRPLLKQWKKATEEMLRELYLAREFLTSQKGQYKDPSGNNYLLHSWSSYCEELGISYQTANNLLRPFTPKELSGTGKDTLLLAPPMKLETTANRALMQARIAEVLRTGDRPSDFTDEEDAEYQRQMKNAKLAEITEKCNVPTYYKANDYFNEALRHKKDITNFKLEDTAQIQAQQKVFMFIDAYLNAFDDPETRAKAAFNLALKTRNLSNEIAEFNFQLLEAEARNLRNVSQESENDD